MPEQSSADDRRAVARARWASPEAKAHRQTPEYKARRRISHRTAKDRVRAKRRAAWAALDARITTALAATEGADITSRHPLVLESHFRWWLTENAPGLYVEPQDFNCIRRPMAWSRVKSMLAAVERALANQKGASDVL